NSVFAMLMAGILSACSLAPQYVRPDAPVAGSYPIATTQNTSNVAAADIGWREFFPDKRLQALIASALENNRDLREAALRIEEARSLYNIQWADRVPNLNATASGSRGRTVVPGVTP